MSIPIIELNKCLCTNYNRGCVQVLTISELVNHITTQCEYNTIQCMKCGELLCKKTLPMHNENLCLYKDRVCTMCNITYPIQQHREHFINCTENQVRKELKQELLHSLEEFISPMIQEYKNDIKMMVNTQIETTDNNNNTPIETTKDNNNNNNNNKDMKITKLYKCDGCGDMEKYYKMINDKNVCIYCYRGGYTGIKKRKSTEIDNNNITIKKIPKVEKYEIIKKINLWLVKKSFELIKNKKKDIFLGLNTAQIAELYTTEMKESCPTAPKDTNKHNNAVFLAITGIKNTLDPNKQIIKSNYKIVNGVLVYNNYKPETDLEMSDTDDEEDYNSDPNFSLYN